VKWLLFVSLLLSGPASLQLAFASDGPAPNNARQWLDSMSGALQALNYDGTFVYLHDGKLEAMRIVHEATPGGEKERLIALTGSAREVLRDEKVVTCIMPDNKSVMVGQSRPRQPFPEVPEDLGSLSPYYQLRDTGEDRIAGLMTRVIDITPRDQYRYGYRFWVDTTNFMLLKFELKDVDGTAIEQVMFTDLKVGERISPATLEPSLTGEGYNWFRQEGGGDAPAVTSSAWTVALLPAGFKMTDSQRRRVRQGGEHAEHMVFTDGLATVSVYVEKMQANQKEFTGLSNRGAMNAYGAVLGDHQVTVVGEVPAATVQSVAHSVSRRQ